MVNFSANDVCDKLQHLTNKLDALELIKHYSSDDASVIKEMFYDDYIVPFKEYSASYDEIDGLINSIMLEIKVLKSENANDKE